MIRAGHQEDSRRPERYVGSNFVEERVVKLGDGGLGHAAGDATNGEPDGKSRRTEDRTYDRSGQRAFGRALADRIALILLVHISPGECPAYRNPVATVMLDERDLVNPRDITGGIAHVGVGALCTFGTWKDDKREIEAHETVLLAMRGSCNIELVMHPPASLNPVDRTPRRRRVYAGSAHHRLGREVSAQPQTDDREDER